MFFNNGKGALVSAKSIAAKSAIDFGLAYLLMHLMNKLRISQTIEKVLPSQQAALLKAIIIGKIITRGSKPGIYNWLGRNKNICSQLNDVQEQVLKLFNMKKTDLEKHL